MKKIITTKKEKDFYNIETIIDDVALIESSISGKSGLLNIKTNELIGEIDYYSTFFDINNKFYNLVKKINNEYFLNVYDVLKHKYVVKDYNIVKQFGQCGYVSLLKETNSDELHFLDMHNLRNEKNIFDLEVDNANIFLESCNERFYVLSKNNSMALYKHGSGLVTNFEYDDINSKNGVTFFYKNNKVRFSKDGKYDSISKEFDEIKFYGWLLYCKDGVDTYIYSNSYFDIELIRKTDNISKLATYFSYVVKNRITEYLFIE